MNHKNFFTKIAIIAIAFVFVACGAQPTSTPLTTVTPDPLTQTLILTPTPNPTNTPTITPTPIGGKSGLLLFECIFEKDTATGEFKCSPKIYTYNTNSQQVDLLLEGYFPAGVSPDGRKVILQKTENEKTDLFIADLAKPEQMVLLRENAEEAVWFPNTEWIGFISPQDKKRQVFIIHPDGNGLTQVTNSSIGAVVLEPVFNDGVFWGEGTGNNIQRSKWTKLDGTETTYINFQVVAPSGKFVINYSTINFLCFGCDLELINVETSEKKNISFKNLNSIEVQPLLDDTWVGRTYTSEPESFIVSSDGAILLNLADLPHSHDPLPESESAENGDSYDLIGVSGGNLSGQSLSPDGNLLLIQHEIVTEKPYNLEVSYFLLNLSTFDMIQLPGLFFTRKDCKLTDNGDLTDCVIAGLRVDQFYWIEIP